MEAKHKLAHAIVAIYHGAESADAASDQWKKVHSGRQFPDDATEHTVSSNPIAPVALLVELGVCASNGDARRLVEQGGLSINGEKHSDTKALITVTSGDQLKAGKKHYFVLRTA
jgi:tyrosyl-tRNA synthetase